MKELLNNAFEQLKQADVLIGKQTYRKQVSLFDVEDVPEIEFNGCKSLAIYLCNNNLSPLLQHPI